MACPIQLGLERNYVMTEPDIHHYRLPDDTGGKWKDLARALGFSEVAIESIEMEKGTSLRECCIELLVLRWLRREGRDATAGKLADALTRAGLKNLADKLIKSEQINNFEIKIRRLSEQLISLQEEGSKMDARIKELEEENLKLRARNEELEDAIQNEENGDLDDTSDVLTDKNQAATELRISKRLKNLTQELNTYVTAPLEVPEVKQDQLKTPVKLDLLTRLSERLQELYSNIQAMVSETCKCSEDLKRDFYDFAYHGLRAEHNELVHRVKDLESTEPEMSEEERENFAKLQKYQVNRQRYVERLDNVWRGLFSPPERLPKTPWSDTTGISDNSKESKKVSRHTDPGARPKQTKSRDQAPSVNCEDDKNESTLNVTKRKTVKSIFRKKEKEKDACPLDSCSETRDS